MHTVDSLHTTLSNEDVEDKMNGLMEVLFPHGSTERVFGKHEEDKYTLLKQHVMLVLTTLQSNPQDKANWPANVIVLGRPQLERLYTPTLMPLPDLWLSLASEAVLQPTEGQEYD